MNEPLNAPLLILYVVAGLCGALVVWSMNSQARQQARLWRVTEAMANGQWWYVSDLSAAAETGPGNIYATLMRLERLGRVESEWEPDREEGRRRRMYRLKSMALPGGGP